MGSEDIRMYVEEVEKNKEISDAMARTAMVIEIERGSNGRSRGRCYGRSRCKIVKVEVEEEDEIMEEENGIAFVNILKLSKNSPKFTKFKCERFERFERFKKFFRDF